MSMSMIRIIGVLVTVAILAVLLTVIYRDAEWTEMYRRTMRPRSRRNQAGPVQWYLSRLEKSYIILDKPFSTSIITVRLTMMIVILTGVGVGILHIVAPLAIVIAGIAVLVAYERWLLGRARKAEEKIVYAFLNEAIPLATHILTATERLDLAFVRMAERTTHKGLSKRLERLSRMAGSPQFATAEDAFSHWAEETGIQAIIHIALATRVAHQYNVPIVELWTELVDVLGKDLDYQRNILAYTAGHRKGTYIFYCFLVIPMLIGYSIGNQYLGSAQRIVFWIVIAFMSSGLYFMVRKSRIIDI